MRKYILILLWLPLFGQVPNTNTFSFLDVKNEIESNGGSTTNSLVDAFANANAGGFDPAYEGSKNSLLNFRNYTHLSGFRYSGENYNFSTQESGGRAFYFKPDGTQMFVAGVNSDAVFAYNLSVAWDVSTSSYASQTFAWGISGEAFGLYFKPDGTKMYAVQNVAASTRWVRQYTLSTPWNVSTASYDAVFFDLSSQDITSSSIYFKPDGTAFYTVGKTNSRIYQYTLGTAWDISTVSYASLSFLTTSQTSTPTGVFMKTDGAKMFIVESANEIFEYTLSTPWNVSTSSYVRTNITSTGMQGLFMRDNGESFFLLYQQEITEYITDFPWSIED